MSISAHIKYVISVCHFIVFLHEAKYWSICLVIISLLYLLAFHNLTLSAKEANETPMRLTAVEYNR